MLSEPTELLLLHLLECTWMYALHAYLLAPLVLKVVMCILNVLCVDSDLLVLYPHVVDLKLAFYLELDGFNYGVRLRLLRRCVFSDRD